jgi:hypothetical protein
MVLKLVEHLVVRRQLVGAVKQAVTPGSSTCDVPLGNFISLKILKPNFFFLFDVHMKDLD